LWIRQVFERITSTTVGAWLQSVRGKGYLLQAELQTILGCGNRTMLKWVMGQSVPASAHQLRRLIYLAHNLKFPLYATLPFLALDWEPDSDLPEDHAPIPGVVMDRPITRVEVAPGPAERTLVCRVTWAAPARLTLFRRRKSGWFKGFWTPEGPVSTMKVPPEASTRAVLVVEGAY